MLALYARYNCTSNADAYREICEALGRYTPRPRVNDCIGVKPEQNARATPQEIHQTYSLLLSMLPLTPTHKAHLLSPRRGLTEEQIARFGFKSTPPAFLCRSYAERLRRHGCTLQGVPGFYQDDAGRWTINFGSRTAGILLPAVGMDGLICGMQIRLDTPLRRRDDPPGKSGAKYIWLSSIGKPHGVTSGSPLHFVGEPFAKTVYVTEGLLKADIAYCLTGRSFVAVAGVNSSNGLESALRCMAQNGTKLVVEAYDMDKLENEYVASAAEKVQQIARVAGLQSTSLVWNTAYKGIDDWQLALRQEEAKRKSGLMPRKVMAESYHRVALCLFRKDRTMGILSEMDMMNRDAEDDAFEVSSDSETVDSFSEEFEPVETPKQEPQAEDAEEARKKAEFDAAEAKRKAEWEAKQAQKKLREQQELDRLAAMSDDDVMQASMNRVSQDTERLTRRNMKLCVMEDVQTECLADPAFARLVMNPKKKMVNCFHYINRKAREYLEQEMRDNDEKPMGGGFGGDVPDELCYQWAREYFRDADAKEDAEPEEKFVPKNYNGKAPKAGKGKKDKPKKATPKPAPKPADEEQLTFGDFGTEEAAG